MKKVLLVDDDVAIHRLVSTLVHLIGDLSVESCYNGLEALEKAQREPPDLIISDVGMPDMDGLVLTRAIRQTPAIADTPILLLTGRADSNDKYLGFLQGADDYLLKPFDATELQLRIKALLRRGNRTPRPVAMRILAGPLELDPHRSLALAQGKEIRFTASEFAILRLLASEADRFVSVESLLVQALDYPPQKGNPQVIHTHVKNIRAKLRQVGIDPDFLRSSRQGYLIGAASDTEG